MTVLVMALGATVIIVFTVFLVYCIVASGGLRLGMAYTKKQCTEAHNDHLC